jgi:hypothetical protein
MGLAGTGAARGAGGRGGSAPSPRAPSPRQSLSYVRAGAVFRARGAVSPPPGAVTGKRRWDWRGLALPETQEAGAGLPRAPARLDAEELPNILYGVHYLPSTLVVASPNVPWMRRSHSYPIHAFPPFDFLYLIIFGFRRDILYCNSSSLSCSRPSCRRIRRALDPASKCICHSALRRRMPTSSQSRHCRHFSRT